MQLAEHHIARKCSWLGLGVCSINVSRVLKVKANQWERLGSGIIMVPDNCPVGSRVWVRVVFWVLPATEGRNEAVKAQ